MKTVDEVISHISGASGQKWEPDRVRAWGRTMQDYPISLLERAALAFTREWDGRGMMTPGAFARVVDRERLTMRSEPTPLEDCRLVCSYCAEIMTGLSSSETHWCQTNGQADFYRKNPVLLQAKGLAAVTGRSVRVKEEPKP